MPNEFYIASLLHKPLPDILKNVYSAEFLFWLYKNVLPGMLREHPDLHTHLPPPSKLKSILRKENLVNLLLAILSDNRRKCDFFQFLPAATRKMLETITWHGDIELDALENHVGEPIADQNPSPSSRNTEPFIVRNPFQFICLKRTYLFHQHYYDKIWPKTCMMATLPSAIRELFQELIPPPPEYNLIPLEAPPKKVPAMFFLAQHIMTDLQKAAEFIEQGHAKTIKNNRLSKPSIRKFREVIHGSEFFENSKLSELEFLRTQILLGAVARADKTLRTKLMQATSPDPVIELFASIKARFLAEELLSHFRFHPYQTCWNHDVCTTLYDFFMQFPADGKWIAIDNILVYFKLRYQAPSPFASSANRTPDFYKNNNDTLQQDFNCTSKPLLQGYPFLLAALGFAEIAYTNPQNKAMPFGGMQAVRLTPLGEFVFGKRETIDIAVSSAPKAEILLDTNRLIATCKNLDSLTELALKQFMDRITEVRIRMTPKSLLSGCSSRQDLEGRIELFRRVISKTPPPAWEAFFTQTLNRVAPLKPDPAWILFKLDTDAETRRLFSTDPTLRQLCIKAEGFRVAIEKSNIRKVCKRLEQLGCLCPPSALFSPGGF